VSIWLVSFIRYDLSFIDLDQRTLQPVVDLFDSEPLIGQRSRILTRLRCMQIRLQRGA
jgi:hypothetical protein